MTVSEMDNTLESLSAEQLEALNTSINIIKHHFPIYVNETGLNLMQTSINSISKYLHDTELSN